MPLAPELADELGVGPEATSDAVRRAVLAKIHDGRLFAPGVLLARLTEEAIGIESATLPAERRLARDRLQAKLTDDVVRFRQAYWSMTPEQRAETYETLRKRADGNEPCISRLTPLKRGLTIPADVTLPSSMGRTLFEFIRVNFLRTPSEQASARRKWLQAFCTPETVPEWRKTAVAIAREQPNVIRLDPYLFEFLTGVAPRSTKPTVPLYRTGMPDRRPMPVPIAPTKSKSFWQLFQIGAFIAIPIVIFAGIFGKSSSSTSATYRTPGYRASTSIGSSLDEWQKTQTRLAELQKSMKQQEDQGIGRLMPEGLSKFVNPDGSLNPRTGDLFGPVREAREKSMKTLDQIQRPKIEAGSPAAKGHTPEPIPVRPRATESGGPVP